LGESTLGGGCLALERVDTASLAGGLGTLLFQPDTRSRLEREARQRTFKSWDNYARELTAWSRSLKRR
jgi:hypothetical protein